MRIRKYMQGITLMELMIVVVIVSILAAISYPNYRNFVARAKRNEAKAILLKIATEQERHYLQNSEFADQLTELGYPTDTIKTDSETFSVEIESGDASNFVAAADYIPDDDEENKCDVFKIDGRGMKTSTPYTDCWTRTR